MDKRGRREEYLFLAPSNPARGFDLGLGMGNGDSAFILRTQEESSSKSNPKVYRNVCYVRYA